MLQPELANPDPRPLRAVASPAPLLVRRPLHGPSNGFLDRIARPRLRPYGPRSAALQNQ